MKKKLESLTYENVAIKHKMPLGMRYRFIYYMRTRWDKPEKEEEVCRYGYADEWAERFLSLSEYPASDTHGRDILYDMDEQNEVVICSDCGRRVTNLEEKVSRCFTCGKGRIIEGQF